MEKVRVDGSVLSVGTKIEGVLDPTTQRLVTVTVIRSGFEVSFMTGTGSESRCGFEATVEGEERTLRGYVDYDYWGDPEADFHEWEARFWAHLM